MKRQIRYGIFESNSSSSHCILITKKDKLLTKDDFHHEDEPWNDEKIYMGIWHNKLTAGYDREDLYYGWGFEILSTVRDKTKYALASLCGAYSGHTDEQKVDYYNEILEALNGVLPELEEIELPKEEIIIYKDLEGNELDEKDVHENWKVSEQSAMFHYYEKDGLKHPAIPTGDYYERPDIGGVDHQSRDLLKNFLKEKNITIADFLLNEKYVVVINDDNNDIWDDFKHNGLIDLDNIVEEYQKGENYESFMEYTYEEDNEDE